MILFLHAGQDSVALGTLRVANAGGGWMNTPPVLLRYTIPGGKATELHKFQFNEMENADQNDHRFQAFYTVSPNHTILAASRHGRVDFYQLSDGATIRTIAFGNQHALPRVCFLGEERAFLVSSWDDLTEFDIAKDEKLTLIPETGDGFAVTPDGKHFATRRELVPVGERMLIPIPVPQVTLWERTR
jgi:hypothetical protein